MAVVKRTVFRTYTQDAKPTDPNKWSPLGGLQVGIDKSIKPYKLYIYWLAAANKRMYALTDVNVVNDLGSDSNNEVELERKYVAGVGDKVHGGFKITIEGFDTDNATFTGQILTSKSEPDTWRGQWTSYTEVPPGVIEKAPEPIPANVQSFLDLNPWVTRGGHTQDIVQDSAGDFLGRMIGQRASSTIKHWVFNDEVAGLNDDYLKTSLPDLVKAQDGYISLKKISSDHSGLLQVLLMHDLCSQLKRCEWFASEFRNACRDKKEDFYSMLRAKEGKPLEDAKDRYGRSTPVVAKVKDYRSEYDDIVERCYYAAYVSRKSVWSGWLTSNPRTFFDQIKGVLLSDSFRVNTIPRWINRKDTPGIPSFQENLAMLGMKLQMLWDFADNTRSKTEVETILDKLVQAAKETGVESRSFVTVAEVKQNIDYALGADDIEMWRAVLAYGPSYASDVTSVSDEIYPWTTDPRSNVINRDLNNDAKPLGLYEWKSIVDHTKDVVQKTGQVIADVAKKTTEVLTAVATAPFKILGSLFGR